MLLLNCFVSILNSISEWLNFGIPSILVSRAYDLLARGWINNFKKKRWALGTRMDSTHSLRQRLRVRFFGKIRIRIVDPRSLGSWCIKGTDESTVLGKDSSVPLMHHDPSDLGSKIRTHACAVFERKVWSKSQ